jgi:periplasmic divalent cation tolerance protein
MNHCIVLCTTSNIDESKKIARILVEQKLAACVNIIPKINSIYAWENNIVEDEEFLLIIKTTKEAFAELKQTIKQNHSYSVPEIIAIDIAAGDENYLNWITKSLS